MFFVVVVVHSFKIYLLEYFSLLGLFAQRYLRGVGIMRIICAVRKDVFISLTYSATILAR
jgi:hypothetical protein